MKFFSGFRAKLQKRVRSVAFQSVLRKRISKLPKFLKILKINKIIQFSSILFNRVLRLETAEEADVAVPAPADDSSSDDSPPPPKKVAPVGPFTSAVCLLGDSPC